MGGKSSSEIKRVVENNMLFGLSLEMMTSTMTNINSSIENKIKQSAENYAEQKNKANLSGTVLIADGGEINIDQANTGESTLSVEQIAEILNEVSASVVTEIAQSISDALDIETIEKLLSEVENQAKNSATGLSSIGRNDSSKVDETIKNNTEVNLNTKLENYIENVVNNNLINHSDKYCGTKFLQSNDFELVDGQITAKNSGVLNLSQKNEVKITSECSQVDKINNKIIVDLCTGVGIDISQEVKTKMQIEDTDKAKNSVENEGLGQDVADAVEGAGNAVSTATQGIGSAIGNIFSSTTSIFFIIFGVICCIVIVVIIGLSFTLTNENTAKNISAIGETTKSIAELTPQGKMASISSKLGGYLFY